MNTLSELSGPSSFVVEADIGKPGVRGNIIHLSNGDPNNSANLDAVPIERDLAINVKTSDPAYLFLYYFENSVWLPKFRLIPNSLSKNQDVTFVNGQATASITAQIPPNISINPTAPEENIDLQYNIVNRIDLSTSVQNPISSFFAITNLTVLNGFATVDFVFNAVEFSGGLWVPVQGEKTMHLVITVV